MQETYQSVAMFGGLSIPGPIVLTALATLLGSVLGIEREWKQKVASIRTFALISGGSAFFSCLSVMAAGASIPGMPFDTTRVAAGIVTGIGFLGGGVIYKSDEGIEGITTGAMIWFAAGVGMACGFNQVGLALWAVVIFFLTELISKPLYIVVAFGRKLAGYKDEE